MNCPKAWGPIECIVIYNRVCNRLEMLDMKWFFEKKPFRNTKPLGRYYKLSDINFMFVDPSGHAV